MPGTPEIYVNSFNYRRYDFRRAARRAKEYGYDGLEIWARHYAPDTIRDDLAEVSRIARQVGLKAPVINLHGNVIGDDPEERAGRLQWLKDLVPRLPDYGVTVANGFAGSLIVDPNNWGLNGSTAATDAHYERAAEAYRALGAIAARAGVLLTFEVHMNTIHDTARATKRLLEMIDSPAVKANIDAGNMRGVPPAEPAPEGVQILGNWIAYAHCKNCRRVSYLPVGVDYDFLLKEGDVDYYAVVSALVQQGFQGPYCLEWSGYGDPSVPTREDLAYFKSLLADVAADRQAEQ
jgi:sugar phosphate isomerase/epimerase